MAGHAGAEVHLGEGLVVEGRARSFRIVADVPVASGGTDAGPTPEELLADALGACTAMTLAMYARRKGWDLRTVDVKVELAGGSFSRVIRVGGALDDEQVARLLEIADKCPVHRIVAQATPVQSTIARGSPA
jgi:putative redox protein